MERKRCKQMEVVTFISRHYFSTIAGAFRDLTERHSPSTKSNQQEITSSKRSDTDNDKVADISLGGQRIRLFGSVKGTVSKHEKSSKRTPLMKETNLTVPLIQSTPRPSLSRPPQRPAPPPPPPLPPPRKTSTSSTTDFQNGTFLNRAAKQAMEEEGIEEMFVGSPKSAVSSQTQCDIQSMDQHKTRITIKCTSRPTHPSVPPPPPPPPPPPTPLPPLPQQQNQQQPLENHQEFPLNEQAASKDKLELQEASCQTVIAVGQEPQDTTTNRLNLKINLSELSAYLKPILKKAAVNESSTSSEAEGSETYSSTSVDVRQKKKKHVHFLSNRLSINSDDASQESSTDNPSSSPLLPDIVSKEHSNITTSSSNTEQDIETKEEDGGQAVESLVGTAGQKMDALEALYDDASSANHNTSNSNTDLQNVDSDGDVQGFATRHALTSDSDADNNRTTTSLGSSNMSVGDQPVDCELLPSRRRNRSLASRGKINKNSKG